MMIEDVYGQVKRGNVIVPISNVYDGYHLRIDGEIDVIEDPNQLKLFDTDELEGVSVNYKDGDDYEYQEGDIVELNLGF